MATQLNNWLSIDKTSGTGNAEITLTASSYSELVDRTTSLKIQGISANAILNVRQNAIVPSATLDSYEITTYGGGTYTNGITSNVPWTAVVNGNWITIDKTQGESGYTTLSITLDDPTEARNGSIVFNAEGVVLTLQIYQIYNLNNSYFWVKFEQPNGVISGLTNSYTDMYHSFDGNTWLTTPKTLSMGNNTLVYFKNDSKKISTDRSHLNVKFNSNARVGGDISSITNMEKYCCYYLFDNNQYLTDASQLILPWTTLARSCYNHMFYNCTNLTTVPELPATTLEQYCYGSMFNGCSNLTTAPVLSATTLASYCYEGMFKGCSNLTTAPALPATTLANSCYEEMFYFCTSLTTAPELPVTTLADYCYTDMFKGCTSLTTAPVLPATTLTYACYYEMFYGCTNIATAPVLPATTLAWGCYYHMFDGCTSLTTAPELPATTSATYCYAGMFKGCSNLTTAPALPATTLANSCYEEMFYFCTSLTTAPVVLPATTLASYCYRFMFDDCTSLTTAPELPATTLADYCYVGMFYDCPNLTYIKMLATDIRAKNCLGNWVANVSTTGTFVKHPDAKLPNGGSGIPSGWTVETATE